MRNGRCPGYGEAFDGCRDEPIGRSQWCATCRNAARKASARARQRRRRHRERERSPEALQRRHALSQQKYADSLPGWLLRVLKHAAKAGALIPQHADLISLRDEILLLPAARRILEQARSDYDDALVERSRRRAWRKAYHSLRELVERGLVAVLVEEGTT